ncbi:hypothetical protein P154DRAFT_608271 [Amniculicola lignicola CBS 123094]|uniref:NAD(P)-binding protein n=1 Tax=Amniculicola lignicola CBS 123094 TaxID=1392246 RepID=A0A6A5W3R5_9PLEO|nr:hypothetical protein P154DRAFT_608271 [Amniculicola lignicola CBS 123094]
MSLLTHLFPPPPTLTPSTLPSLSTKVYLITNATTPTNLSLASLLYSLDATIYLGCPTPETYTNTMSTLTSTHPTSKGTLHPFIYTPTSLSTLKPAVEILLAQEYRLDVLFHGTASPPSPSHSQTPLPQDASDHDLDITTNLLAPFLLTALLTPLMSSHISHFCSPNTSIRVLWPSSHFSPTTPEGILQWDALTNAPRHLPGRQQQAKQIKAAAPLLAHEFNLLCTNAPSETSLVSTGNRVLHVALHAGFVKGEVEGLENIPALMRGLLGPLLKGPEYGALTMLYAALSPSIQAGDFILPWGRRGSVPAHILASTRVAAGQDKSVSARLYEWCEGQVGVFM